MWVDAVLVVAMVAMIALLVEGAYTLGKGAGEELGYDVGYQAAIRELDVPVYAPWEHRPARRIDAD